MPDISMCEGGACPMKAKCYRHTAKPSEYQQCWFVAPPFDAATGTCEHLVPVDPPPEKAD